MTLDKQTRKRLLAFCGQLQEDDAIDPRQFFKTGDQSHKQKHKHKSLQLCRQVSETLGLLLAGEFGDARLHNLQVVSVDPAPNDAHLAVTVRTDDACDSSEQHEILRRLANVNGRLRCEIAQAISRKHTPTLTFRIVGPTDIAPQDSAPQDSGPRNSGPQNSGEVSP